MKNLNLFLIIALIGLFIFLAMVFTHLKNIEAQLSASIVQFERFLQENETDSLKNFAQCLSQKGIKLYGSSQNVETKKQKAIFQKAVNYLTYIECLEPDSKELLFECQLEGIKIFPTWEFPNKERKTGILSLEELKELSGCEF